MNRISHLTRRLWAALLALCLMLALTLPVFAEGESGTEEKESYHIGTVDELLQLADSCRLDSWSENRTVYLDADLELTGSDFVGIPTFSGVFEGQGHVISGLSLVSDGSVVGFFRYVQEGANIRDLVVRGRAMPTGSRSTVGGIAGSQTGYIEGCVNYGTVYARKEAGGIVGQMEPSSTLQYTKDTLQELSDEMTTLQSLVNRACDDASAASSSLSGQLSSLQNSVTSSRNAIENLLKQTEDGISIGSQTISTDLSQFKQNIKNADIPDGFIGGDNNDNNNSDSDPDDGTQAIVKDYSDEATSQPSIAPIDPDYTLSPSEEFGTDDNSDDSVSTQSEVSDEAPVTDTPVEDTPAVQSEDAAPADNAEREAHGQPDPDDSTGDNVTDYDNATKQDETDIIDPGYTLISDENITDNLPSSKDVLNGISDALPSSVDVEIPKVELTNRDAITASKNDLSSNLTGMGDIVSSLNSTAQGNSQTLINDVRAISNQINKIGQTLSNASENVNKNADDLVDDISDDDTADDVEAKVTNCINSGEVNADLNAGGIAGAMARENDLDPEDDYSTAGSESLNFTFKTRVVARDCTNYGTVSAKKQNAGGIVGNAEMGSVIDCKGFGTVDAEDATAVGGVAGVSKSTIRESYAKCRLSGAKQVGGIAGSGATITDCRAMVVIDAGSEQLGAIAGVVDDPLDGSVKGNTFVDEGVAGIDSVSYADIAEPLPYDNFAAQENLPSDFASVCVRFVTDEDSLVQQYYIPYGSDFPTDQLPPVPNHEGQYGNWEDIDLTNMTFDATIHAEYSDMNTVRQSQAKRDGRPIVLVEGSFDTTDELMLHEIDDAPTALGTLVEAWGLELPADTGHTLRYMPPETTDNTELWVKTDAGWQQAATSVDGSYLTCTAPAGTTAFAAVKVPASKVPLYAAIGGAAAALLLVILFVVRKHKNKKKK